MATYTAPTPIKKLSEVGNSGTSTMEGMQFGQPMGGGMVARTLTPTTIISSNTSSPFLSHPSQTYQSPQGQIGNLLATPMGLHHIQPQNQQQQQQQQQNQINNAYYQNQTKPATLLVTKDKIYQTPRDSHCTVATGKIDPTQPSVRTMRVVFEAENGKLGRVGTLYEQPNGAYSTEQPNSNIGNYDSSLNMVPQGNPFDAFPTPHSSYPSYSYINTTSQPITQLESIFTNSQIPGSGLEAYSAHYNYIASILMGFEPSASESTHWQREPLINFLARDLYNYFVQPTVVPAPVPPKSVTSRYSSLSPRANFILDYILAMYQTVVSNVPFAPPVVPDAGVQRPPQVHLPSALSLAMSVHAPSMTHNLPSTGSTDAIRALSSLLSQIQIQQQMLMQRQQQLDASAIASKLNTSNDPLQQLFIRQLIGQNGLGAGAEVKTEAVNGSTSLDLLSEQIKALIASADLQAARERAIADNYNLAVAPHPHSKYDFSYDSRREARRMLDVPNQLGNKQYAFDDDYAERVYRYEKQKADGNRLGVDARQRLHFIERSSLHQLNKMRDRLLRDLSTRQARFSEYSGLKDRANVTALKLNAYQATLLNQGIHEKLQASNLSNQPPHQGFEVKCPVPPPPPPPASDNGFTTPSSLQGTFPLWCPRCYPLSIDQIETFFAVHPEFLNHGQGSDPKIVGTQPMDLIFRSYYDPSFIWPFELREALLDPRDRQVLREHWRVAQLDLERQLVGQGKQVRKSYTDDEVGLSSRGVGLYRYAFGGASPAIHNHQCYGNSLKCGPRCFSNIGGAGARERLERALSKQRQMAVVTNTQLQAHREIVENSERRARMALRQYSAGPSAKRLAELSSNRPCTTTCGAYNEMMQIALGNRSGITPPQQSCNSMVRESVVGIPSALYVVRSPERTTSIPVPSSLSQAAAIRAGGLGSRIVRAPITNSNSIKSFVAESQTPGYSTILMPQNADLNRTIPSRSSVPKAISF